MKEYATIKTYGGDEFQVVVGCSHEWVAVTDTSGAHVADLCIDCDQQRYRGMSSRVGIASDVDLPIIRSATPPKTNRAKQSERNSWDGGSDD